jgi:hypothetical protein
MPQNLILDSKLNLKEKVNPFWDFITLKIGQSHVKNQKTSPKARPIIKKSKNQTH